MRETVNSIYTRDQEREMAAKQAEEAAYLKRNQTHAVNECATDASCGRQSARGVIEHRYESLLREANGLHALLRALPQDMSPAAEEALWKLVVDQRR